MPTQNVIVASRVGLHGRPAAVIAEAAARFAEEILVSLVHPRDIDAEPADAASPLMLMSLGAKCGDEVSVSSTNAAAVARICELIETELDG